MDATLYVLRGSEEEKRWQRDAITGFMGLRRAVEQEFNPRSLSENGGEFFNMFNLSSKCISFFHTMDAKQMHKLLKTIGGAPEYEDELRELGARAAAVLAASAPIVYGWERYADQPASAGVLPEYSRAELLAEVESAGGKIADGRYVLEVGCRLLQPSPEVLSALYGADPEYVKRLPVQFKLSGLSYETVLELVAHSEATVGDLPDALMRYMAAPAYRLQGASEEQAWQRAGIERFLDLKSSIAERYSLRKNPEDEARRFNGFDLGSRAVMVTFTMSLHDYHNLFIGRLSVDGNEQEVQELCRKMCGYLHARFPEVIASPEAYYQMNNAQKY